MKPRLLIVDDERPLRERYQRSLEAEFEVGAVEGGAVAIERLEDEAFDLVIADETVSDMDGFAFVSELRERDVLTPVILLTERLDNLSVLRARERDALCLAKPIEPEVLARAARLRVPKSVRKRSPLRSTLARFKTVTASDAKTKFRRVLDTAVREGQVVITRYEDPCALLVSVYEYERLVSATQPSLEQLSAELDELLEQMQTPQAQAGAASLFSMSSEELGRAAVTAADQGE